MFPAERSDAGQEPVRDVDTLSSQMIDGAAEIDGVPEDDSRGDEVEPGRPMPLVLEGAVAQLAEAVEEYGSRERIAGLSLIEVRAGATPKLWIVRPVEHEQGSLDPPDLSQAPGDRVLSRVAGEFLQHDGGRDDASLDGGGQA